MAEKTPPRLQGLAPQIPRACRVLVLGSFPGGRSLELQQYYAHPQNHFWPIMACLIAGDRHAWKDLGYAERLQRLGAAGVGLWDVYASCEREGSLDTAIRHAEVNDFASLRQRCPALALICHNGGESHRHARHTEALGVPVLKMPSTSPANASWSFERKLDAWRQALQHHLIA